jgi:hypothetical protein
MTNFYQSMNVAMNSDGTATATVAFNLAKSPVSVGVEYDGEVYETLCRNEPCNAKNGTALLAQGEVQIVIPLHEHLEGFQDFRLKIVEG